MPQPLGGNFPQPVLVCGRTKRTSGELIEVKRTLSKVMVDSDRRIVIDALNATNEPAQPVRIVMRKNDKTYLR